MAVKHLTGRYGRPAGALLVAACALALFASTSCTRDATPMNASPPDSVAEALDSDQAMPVNIFGARFPLPEPLLSVADYDVALPAPLDSTLQVRCYADADSPGKALDLYVAEERHKIEAYAMLERRDSLTSVRRAEQRTFAPGGNGRREKNTAAVQRARLRYGSGSEARVAAFAFEAAGSPRIACPPVRDGRYRSVPAVAADSLREEGQRVWLLRWRPPGAKAIDQQQTLWMDMLRSVRRAAQGPGRLGLHAADSVSSADSAQAGRTQASGGRLAKRFHAGHFSVGLPREARLVTPDPMGDSYEFDFVSEDRESDFEMSLGLSVEGPMGFGPPKATIERIQNLADAYGETVENEGPVEIDGHSGYQGVAFYDNRSDPTVQGNEYASATVVIALRSKSPKKHLTLSASALRAHWSKYKGFVRGILNRMKLKSPPEAKTASPNK